MIEELIALGRFVIEALARVWPLLLVTIPFAALVRLTGNVAVIRRVLGRRPVVAVLIATAIGAVSPLCSCGVIPVIVSLLASGVPLGPVMAFWLASPSMDPEIFFLSVTTLGWNLAVWRLGATFIMSLAGGLVAWRLQDAGILGGKVLKDRAAAEFDPQEATTFGAPQSLVPACSCDTSVPLTRSASPAGASDARYPGLPSERPTISFLHRFVREMGNSAVFVVKFLFLAYLLEALITRYMPEQLVVVLLGAGGWYAVPLATAIGVPLYTTNISALGVVGGLLAKGMDPGAALAFLVGGATTTVPAMAAVFGITTRRVFLLYLGIAAGSALFTGVLYSLLV